VRIEFADGSIYEDSLERAGFLRASGWFGGSLTRSGAIILPYPWGQCMETTGDYVCWNNVDPNYFLYGGRGGGGCYASRC
jgi:hypothetical protein